MIGKKLSPILFEIEQTILEHEVNIGTKPEYTTEAFRASVKIFMSCIMDKMYDLQDIENMSPEDRMNMAQKLGENIRKIVKTYADIDTHTLYKTKKLKN